MVSGKPRSAAPQETKRLSGEGVSTNWRCSVAWAVPVPVRTWWSTGCSTTLDATGQDTSDATTLM